MLLWQHIRQSHKSKISLQLNKKGHWQHYNIQVIFTNNSGGSKHKYPLCCEKRKPVSLKYNQSPIIVLLTYGLLFLPIWVENLFLSKHMEWVFVYKIRDSPYGALMTPIQTALQPVRMPQAYCLKRFLLFTNNTASTSPVHGPYKPPQFRLNIPEVQVAKWNMSYCHTCFIFS